MTQRRDANADTQTHAGPSRRGFLGCLGLSPGLTGLAGTTLLGMLEAPSAFANLTPINAAQRRNRAFVLRRDAAMFERDRPDTPSISNHDEELYASRIASYSKGLPHSDLGEVDLNAYNAYLQALNSGLESDFEAIPLGGTAKLANPQAAYCFTLEGADAAALAIPPAPAFSSARMAAEIAEDYWCALTRDVPFSQYGSDPLIAQAVADLSKFTDYGGPKVNGQVTSDVLFRGMTPGDLNGPYLSQFLLKTIPMGAATLPQFYKTAVAGSDYLTNYADWIKALRGGASGTNIFDSNLRYIRNNRDLSLYLLSDFMGEANILATLLLMSYGNPALAPSNPYLHSVTQAGGVTFGVQQPLDLVVRVMNEALRATFFQKWLVHRRLRPETFGGRIHNHVTGAASYPIHSDILNSAALKAVFSAHGTYLLPMAYPTGSPLHPSYPAAHAAVVGAGVTALKALFNESFVIPTPVVASDDGTTLVPYTGSALTVGDELNKLAANISLGRDAAGVHYRSDGIEGIQLGEAIAISILRDTTTLFHEQFPGFTLTRFDGTQVTICGYC
jgi:PAP2 superfamily